jgi:hypothetical protein
MGLGALLWKGVSRKATWFIDECPREPEPGLFRQFCGTTTGGVRILSAGSEMCFSRNGAGGLLSMLSEIESH